MPWKPSEETLSRRKAWSKYKSYSARWPGKVRTGNWPSEVFGELLGPGKTKGHKPNLPHDHELLLLLFLFLQPTNEEWILHFFKKKMCNRLYGPQSLKYFLYDTLQKTFGWEQFQWIGGGKSLTVVGFNIKWEKKLKAISIDSSNTDTWVTRAVYCAVLGMPSP